MKFFMMLMIASFTYIYAGVIAKVAMIEGYAKIKKHDSIRKKRLHVGDVIEEGDVVSTSKKGIVKFLFNDNSIVILDKNSIINFHKQNDIQQEEGKAFYKITSRDRKNKLKVRTNFAIIGIKGTTFIVKASDKSKEVLLKEGLVGVQSIKEEFELYVKQVNAEFEAFKRQQESDFEKYKSQFAGYGTPVKTKEFDLQESNKISFDSNKVFQDPFGTKDKREFAYFENYLNEKF